MIPGARRRRLATADQRLAELQQIQLPGGLLVFVARSWAERRDGLAGLPGLPAGWGLWIAPCRSIHTVGMRFALDLVWLDKDSHVLQVTSGVVPRRFRGARAARSVIEVPAGRGNDFASAWNAGAPAET